MKSAALLCCLVSLTGVTPLLGQTTIGHLPSETPYEDVPSPQRISLFGGYFDAHKDDAGAAPQSAPMFGAQYEVTIDGPAQFFARAAWVNSKRTSYDLAALTTSQTIKTTTVGDAMLLGDVGISVNLTGQKTWHHIIPTVAFAVGVASARGSVPDDPYDFGTQFSFSSDFMLNYVFARVYQLRVGVGNTMYQNHYPSGYYTVTSDSVAIIGSKVPKSSYLNNWRFTAGLAVPLFR